MVGQFRHWVRPLSARALERSFGWPLALIGGAPVRLLNRILRKKSEGIRLECVESFGPEFDRFADLTARRYGVCCVRDAAYLGWRYLAAPARRQVPLAVRREGELVGLVVIEVAGDRLAITDLFTSPDAAVVDATLQATLDHAEAKGCASVEIGLLDGSLAAQRLGHLGFLPRAGRGFQVMGAMGEPPSTSLWTAGSWHFCTADEDRDTVVHPQRNPEEA
jgi:hypothetical protein